MAELPSGAVTFLFTDIEGSTRLVKQFRERYEEVLADHQRLLRAAFTAHGGHEVDTQGDSFFVVFGSARDAVLAAVEGQLALLSHPWPDGEQVKVRMGLHTGQARAADGRYTGLAVHRAARIGAAGHGGQILVSQATQTLLEDEEEDLHVFLRDLGEQRLKDLDRPVRLYQAAADGLPQAFPPPRGEAPLAEAAAVALAPPLWRRRPTLAAAGLVLLALLAAAAFLATRDSAGGLAGVRPNHVGIIDPTTNEIVGEVPVGTDPGAIAIGNDAVWVANAGDLSVSRINPRTRTRVRSIAVPATPTGLAFAGGLVWVVHGLLGTVSRIDPDFDRLLEPEIDTGVGRSSGGSIAAGRSGVWVALAGHDIAYVGRIRPSDGRIGPRGFPAGRPTAIAVGDDAAWVANGGEGSTISRVNLTTATAAGNITVGRRPAAIAVSSDTLWVANSADDNVAVVDPASNSVRDFVAVGDEPVAVAFGEGYVWVANAGDGTVSRIDPATNDVTTREVGGRPEGIAVGGGVVWVAVRSP